ncbi:MAG: hypothetical protein JW384_03850 [Nitrosomonadaceae bacterium]|nr:hypothetical protein [Nitrosomonadaceae bacterium]
MVSWRMPDELIAKIELHIEGHLISVNEWVILALNKQMQQEKLQRALRSEDG